MGLAAVALPVVRLSRRGLLAALAGAAAATSRPLVAEASGLDLDLHYALTQWGLSIADLTLQITQDSSGIKSELTLRDKGLAALSGDSWSHLQAESRMDGDEVRPVRFTAHLVKPDRERDIEILYGPDGVIQDLTYLNNGRAKDSDVSATSYAGTVDPLTAVLRLRHWAVGRDKDQGPMTTEVEVFDGRKRYGIVVSDDGQANGSDRDLLVTLLAKHGFDRGDPFMTFPGDKEPDRLRVSVRGNDQPVPVLALSTDQSLRAELVSGPG